MWIIGGMVRLVLPVLHNKQHEHSAMYSGRKEGGIFFLHFCYSLLFNWTALFWIKGYRGLIRITTTKT